MFLLSFPPCNTSLKITNFDVSNNCPVEDLDECIGLCGDGSFANYECTSEGLICTCSDECLDYEPSKTNTQVWAINPVRSQWPHAGTSLGPGGGAFFYFLNILEAFFA
jgi:hypothetical protein